MAIQKDVVVEVRTASQVSFIPFTPVPDSWQGRRVRLVLLDDDGQGNLPAFQLAADAE